MNRLKVGSLFPGIGGIDLAFIQARFEVAWANEIDADACKTYRHIFPDRVPVILDDYGIRKTTPCECLALQGFPKNYRFSNVPMASTYKQCGNSVVGPVIKEVQKTQ